MSIDPKILIVEDRFADVEITKKKLSRFMSLDTLDVVRTTKQALERLEEERFDCILLDLNLPDSIGPSSISDILEVHPRLPIVVLTGFASQVTIEEALKAGARKVISKNDLDSASLKDALQAAMPSRRFS
jgi:CheY-like chemotaxis protein